ncbi:MAG: hypothetical protein J5I53_00295 [Bradyrhizobiaceae bacterium]|nr:hypothetical protein [Bradyrhizobiaceae bacterium]
MGSDTTGKKPFYKKWWVWVLAVVIVIGIASQSGKKGDTGTTTAQAEGATEQAASAAEPAPEPTIKVSAVDYYQEYDANEVAADERYKGKTLEITGEVTGVEKTMGTVYVNLRGDELIGWVHCALEDESGASKISKGQNVTLVGKGAGKMGFARVEDCKIK